MREVKRESVAKGARTLAWIEGHLYDVVSGWTPIPLEDPGNPSDGQTGIAHCPDEYNRLELEVAATGERLTAAHDRKPADFFHSRLSVSPSGRYLLSAGWVWQPFDTIEVFDLWHALDEPATLDGDPGLIDLGRFTGAEISGACFVGDDFVVGSANEPQDPEDPEDLGEG